jgi:hypothetical protein
MAIYPNSYLLRSLEYEDLIEYLSNTDWQLEEPSDRWIVFVGSEDIDGNSLAIVLPSDETAPDLYKYTANAINILSAVRDLPPEDIITEVRYYDRDVLRVRNLEKGDVESISLKTAAKQVAELRQLVAYSALSEAALSEDRPKPFFLNTRASVAQRMVERYQFGHTFRGSFGFTVESPKVSKESFAIIKSMLPEIVDDQKTVPLGRRVMERIVRGLLITEEATSDRDANKIINGYDRGFNANMCRAIVNMSLGKKVPMEYRVSWSAVMPPSDEAIIDTGPIQLREYGYEHLDYAAEILSELEPEEVTITGQVKVLSADDNPLGLDTSRSIIIRWFDDMEGRTNNVHVQLEKDDYLTAIQAHRDWSLVTIKGLLRRIKRNWRIVEYSDFRIKAE